MRTTLDIDETVLAAARSLARAEHISIGAAVSELARRGLRGAGSQGAESQRIDVGYSPFPVVIGEADLIVTDDLVLEHRDG